MLSIWTSLKFSCLVKSKLFPIQSGPLTTLTKSAFENIVGKENAGNHFENKRAMMALYRSTG